MAHISTDVPLMTPDEVSQLLGVAKSTLVTWRKRNRGPTPIRVGHRTIRYARAEVEAWLESRQGER